MEGAGLHCKENPIYVFLFWELRGLSPNIHILVSVNDLYIPRIGPHISCSRIGSSSGIYKSLTDIWMWKFGLWPHNFFSGNICFEFSVLVLCSVTKNCNFFSMSCALRCCCRGSTSGAQLTGESKERRQTSKKDENMFMCYKSYLQQDAATIVCLFESPLHCN